MIYIVLFLAIVFSFSFIISLFKAIALGILNLLHKTSKTDEWTTIITTIIASLLWTLFYYLSH